MLGLSTGPHRQQPPSPTPGRDLLSPGRILNLERWRIARPGRTEQGHPLLPPWDERAGLQGPSSCRGCCGGEQLTCEPGCLPPGSPGDPAWPGPESSRPAPPVLRGRAGRGAAQESVQPLPGELLLEAVAGPQPPRAPRRGGLETLAAPRSPPPARPRVGRRPTVCRNSADPGCVDWGAGGWAAGRGGRKGALHAPRDGARAPASGEKVGFSGLA